VAEEAVHVGVNHEAEEVDGDEGAGELGVEEVVEIALGALVHVRVLDAVGDVDDGHARVVDREEEGGGLAGAAGVLLAGGVLVAEVQLVVGLALAARHRVVQVELVQAGLADVGALLGGQAVVLGALGANEGGGVEVVAVLAGAAYQRSGGPLGVLVGDAVGDVGQAGSAVGGGRVAGLAGLAVLAVELDGLAVGDGGEAGSLAAGVRLREEVAGVALDAGDLVGGGVVLLAVLDGHGGRDALGLAQQVAVGGALEALGRVFVPAQYLISTSGFLTQLKSAPR